MNLIQIILLCMNGDPYGPFRCCLVSMELCKDTEECCMYCADIFCTTIKLDEFPLNRECFKQLYFIK